MAIILPAILEKTKEAFKERLNLVCKIPGITRIQVDFADNIFVSNLLLSAAEIESLNPAFFWEAHLMCSEPRDFFDYKICGFNKIIIHLEAYKNLVEVQKSVDAILALGIEPGVCLNLETNINLVKELKNVKNFQFMAIKPGFQGSPFHPEVLERIKNLRQILPHAIIEVDGGVNETNIKSINQAGADLICVGSALVKAENLNLAYESLYKEIS